MSKECYFVSRLEQLQDHNGARAGGERGTTLCSGHHLTEYEELSDSVVPASGIDVILDPSQRTGSDDHVTMYDCVAFVLSV